MGREMKLNDLVRMACEAYDKLTPEQQAAHREAQRKSWVVGEMMIEHPELTKAEVEQIYEEIVK